MPETLVITAEHRDRLWQQWETYGEQRETYGEKGYGERSDLDKLVVQHGNTVKDLQVCPDDFV